MATRPKTEDGPGEKWPTADQTLVTFQDILMSVKRRGGGRAYKIDLLVALGEPALAERHIRNLEEAISYLQRVPKDRLKAAGRGDGSHLPLHPSVVDGTCQFRVKHQILEPIRDGGKLEVDANQLEEATLVLRAYTRLL